MPTVTPAAETDPRQLGWPCQGAHKPGKERSNQYATWTACARCGLRLSYLTKKSHTGYSRAVGPPYDLVAEAQTELQQQFSSQQMTDKIFNGKLMEVKGRRLVESGGMGRQSIQVRADERLGRAMLNEPDVTTAYPKTAPMKPPRMKAASPPPASKARSPSPSKTPGASSNPHELPKNDIGKKILVVKTEKGEDAATTTAIPVDDMEDEWIISSEDEKQEDKDSGKPSQI